MAQKPAGFPARSKGVTESASASVTDLSSVRNARGGALADCVAPPGANPTPESRKVANRRFDAEKVARLKAEIAAGRYQIDPFSVADRFIEHERNGG